MPLSRGTSRSWNHSSLVTAMCFSISKPTRHGAIGVDSKDTTSKCGYTAPQRASGHGIYLLAAKGWGSLLIPNYCSCSLISQIRLHLMVLAGAASNAPLTDFHPVLDIQMARRWWPSRRSHTTGVCLHQDTTEHHRAETYLFKMGRRYMMHWPVARK